MAEGEVSRGYWRLPRPDELVSILLHRTTLPGWHAVCPGLMVRHRHDGSLYEHVLAVAIPGVFIAEGTSIDCDHRVLAGIAAVEHLDQLGVPVFHGAMVTVE